MKYTTQLSSAGLIFFHFGHRVISAITGKNCGGVTFMHTGVPERH